MTRLTVEEGLEKIMSVAIKPDADPEEIMAAATAALNGTCNWGFTEGVRWQLRALEFISDEGRDKLIATAHEYRNM